MQKLAEGGYNKVFRLVMDDGMAVIARIPNPNAGPRFYTTASEVATMEFVSGAILFVALLTVLKLTWLQARTILDIPVPRLYCWSTNDSNPVGSEYIIMEKAVGKQLASEWDKNLSANAKLTVMRELVTVEAKLLSVSFSQ